MLLALGHQVIHLAQRVFIYLQEVSDAGHAGQALDHLAQHFLILDAGDNREVVPHAIDHQLRVQITEHDADVLGELADEMLAHRPALDGDLWEDFYD
ncbi:hypothetical protein D3C76_1311940 [compost metagenome]